MSASDRRPLRGQRGLSIIEIMVGLVVSLLVGLAAAGSAKVFTASQRQGMGYGGMAVGASTALAAMKSDIASAGLGFFGDSSFKCHSLSLSVGTTLKFDGASFAPARVTRTGTGSAATDRLDVLYSTAIDGGANVLISGTANAGAANLMSLLPVSTGQTVLLAPATAGTTCLVRTVTAVTASTETTPQNLTFANTGTYNQGTFTTSPTYAEEDRVAVLGDIRWSRYSLSGTNLILERPMDGTSATLMRNVIGFRVQYGVSADDVSTTLTGWENPTGGTWGSVAGADVNRVRALRIGIATRSAQREKPNDAGTCEASSAKPQLFGVDVEPDVSTTTDDWRCYRYRTTVVVVPLRNMVW
jgi:type IV pilus assembly protein PilW